MKKLLIPALLLIALIFIRADDLKPPNHMGVNLLYNLGYMNMNMPPDIKNVVRWKYFGEDACSDMMYYRIQNSSPTIRKAELSPPDSGVHLRQITIRHKLHYSCFNQRSFMNASSVLKKWKSEINGKIHFQDSMQVGRYKFVMIAYNAKLGANKMQVFRAASYVKSQWLEFECVSTHKKNPRFTQEMLAVFRSIRFR